MTTGLRVFDTTLQETNLWLQAVEQRLEPCDRQQAYAALRAVLQTLRDHLTFEAVLALSAQLPMLVRGFYLEGWRPVEGVERIRDPQAFADAVAGALPPSFPREPDAVVHAVFAVLADKLDPGEVDKLRRQLPSPLGVLWPPDYRG
jgi:uncharacterized protein (DUF2267 family)